MENTSQVTLGQSILAFVRLIRWPNLLIIAFTQYFTRIFLILEADLTWSNVIEVLDYQLALIVLSTLFIAASGYIINDYYDIKIDLINKPHRVVIGRYIKRRWAMVINQIFNVAGLLLGLLVGKKSS
jgi:4-hydroxybenzoate polyprenyltransferase